MNGKFRVFFQNIHLKEYIHLKNNLNKYKDV